MRNLFKFSFVVLSVQMLTACPAANNRPRVEHEGRKEWTRAQTPVDTSVDVKSFNSFDVQSAYSALRDGKGDLINRVLKPLVHFVLNGKFIENAEYRNTRMRQMIEIFNTALLDRIVAKDTSGELREIKAKFTQTVFAGCSRDLKSDCFNADLFTQDTRHTRLMTLLALDFDKPIEEAVKTAGSSMLCVLNNPNCQDLVETRYRLLAMALYKRNRYDDPDFSFAYLKHARIFSELMQVLKTLPPGEIGNMSTSYLAESHAKIFETIIPKFKPRDERDPIFREFVDNFKPWGYSRRRADIFQYGTGIMFNFAANCCMYKDEATKNQLSESMESTIRAEQKNPDALSPSLLKMIQEIEAEHGDKLFVNMRINDIVAQAKIVDKPNPAFYNEYFFVVDRLFRGDLTAEDVEMVLRKTNQNRLKSALPAMISAYIKINMAYMVVDTNRFMRREIYTSGVRADKVFEKALTTSRSLTSQWHDMQKKIGQLERLMGSYFKSHFITSPEYVEADKTIKAINRNVHYLSVYPQMMVLNYYLATMNGKLSFDTWWGRIEIDAGTIIGNFFDGYTTNPWFRFGIDPENLSRQMLLFSFEYLLSTETLKYFSGDRSRFFDMVIGKYFDIELEQLNSYIANYERDIYSQSSAGGLNDFCDYELGKTSSPPPVELNFLELNKYTYTGLGDAGLRSSLMKILTGTGNSTDMLRGTIESRALFIRSMLEVLNADLQRRGEFRADHPDTKRIRDGLASMEGLKLRLARIFAGNHKRYFDCAFTLDQVERRRANRLYEEERKHLALIYKMLEPMKEMSDPAALQAAATAKTAELRRLGYRFDKVDAQKGYKYSKYDLFKRIQKNIESDIFQVAIESEKAAYREDVNKYNRARPVRISEPANVERDPIVSEEKSIQLYLRGSEQDFINQGMMAFNGKTGSFLDWNTQLQRDPQLERAIPPMIEFYLMGPVKDGARTLEITKEALVKSYLEVLGATAMNPLEVENAKQFGDEGVVTKAYFKGRLFEADFKTRLPVFYELARKVSGSAELIFDSKYRLSRVLEFATIYQSLQPFVFEPTKVPVVEADGKTAFKYHVTETVKSIYGAQIHELFNRVIDMLKYIDEIEKQSTLPGGSVGKSLGKEFLSPFYVDNGKEVYWYDTKTMPSDMKWIADTQKRDDVKDVLSDFISRSGDFYGTSKKVQAP